MFKLFLGYGKYYRVPSVLENSLNTMYWVFLENLKMKLCLKSGPPWIFSWESWNFLFCVFWTESLNDTKRSRFGSTYLMVKSVHLKNVLGPLCSSMSFYQYFAIESFAHFKCLKIVQISFEFMVEGTKKIPWKLFENISQNSWKKVCHDLLEQCIMCLILCMYVELVKY